MSKASRGPDTAIVSLPAFATLALPLTGAASSGRPRRSPCAPVDDGRTKLGQRLGLGYRAVVDGKVAAALQKAACQRVSHATRADPTKRAILIFGQRFVLPHNPTRPCRG